MGFKTFQHIFKTFNFDLLTRQNTIFFLQMMRRWMQLMLPSKLLTFGNKNVFYSLLCILSPKCSQNRSTHSSMYMLYLNLVISSSCFFSFFMLFRLFFGQCFFLSFSFYLSYRFFLIYSLHLHKSYLILLFKLTYTFN